MLLFESRNYNQKKVLILKTTTKQLVEDKYMYIFLSVLKII